jgi:hypothetical protein
MREQIRYFGDEDPVRNIVGFAAGGATDTTARLIGQCLSERLGVPPETVVINDDSEVPELYFCVVGLALRVLGTTHVTMIFLYSPCLNP